MTQIGEVAVEKVDRNEAICAALTRPGATVTAVAKEFGISRKRVKQIETEGKKRIVELKEVRTDLLALKFENVTERLVDELLTRDLSKVNPVSLMTAAGIATDKALLLRGRPTQIVGGEVRHKLDELLPAMLAEAKRRGMMIDVTPTLPAIEAEPAA